MPEELTLLPCPACKRHSAGIAKTNGTGIAFVMCRYVGCALSGPIRKTDEAAVAAWNAMPRDLTWTEEPPKVPGWYWCRCEEGIVTMRRVWKGDIETPSKIPQQWAGPIPEPREPLNS